jgi:hypothetical protein
MICHYLKPRTVLLLSAFCAVLSCAANSCFRWHCQSSSLREKQKLHLMEMFFAMTGRIQFMTHIFEWPSPPPPPQHSFAFFMYVIQHCFICRHSDSTVSKDAGIEHRTFAILALAVRRSNYLATSHNNLWAFLYSFAYSNSRTFIQYSAFTV